MSKVNTFIVEEIIDLEENNIFTLVDDNDDTLTNKATVLIRNQEINLYYANGDVESFGSDYNALLNKVNELGYKFIKRTNIDNRWYEFNPNPENHKIGDCTLRAYCAAFDIEWDEAFDIASKIAKENAMLIEHVATEVLTNHFGCTVDENYNKKTVKSKDRITVNEFALTHPYGTYVLFVRKHCVTVKDGEYWDSWDSGEKKVDTVFLVNDIMGDRKK